MMRALSTDGEILLGAAEVVGGLASGNYERWYHLRRVAEEGAWLRLPNEQIKAMEGMTVGDAANGRKRGAEVPHMYLSRQRPRPSIVNLAVMG